MNRRTAITRGILLVLTWTRCFADQTSANKLNQNLSDSIRLSNQSSIKPFPKLDVPKNEWKISLPEAAYQVLFEENTEPRFSSPLNLENRKGTYVCRACGLALFTSAMKYDSGTGWPSFFTSIESHLGTKKDYKLIFPRTEYHCRKCGGHQGHVFEDGPAPTYKRWCNNGISLTFIPKT